MTGPLRVCLCLDATEPVSCVFSQARVALPSAIFGAEAGLDAPLSVPCAWAIGDVITVVADEAERRDLAWLLATDEEA